MSWALFIFVLATAVDGHLTTSIAVPFELSGTQNVAFYPYPSNPGYVASIISVTSDTTSVYVAYDDDYLSFQNSYYGGSSYTRFYWTWVVGGTTSFSELYQGTLSTGTVTDRMELTRRCNIRSSTAFCPEIQNRPYQFSQWCSWSGLSSFCADTTNGPEQNTYISAWCATSGPPPPITRTFTVNLNHIRTPGISSSTISFSTVTFDLGFCKTDSVVPDSVLAWGPSPMGSIKMVITAGEEKLSATTAFVVTGTTTTDAVGPKNTGIAPRITAAPLLAGLGAAAAVFAL